MALHRGGREGPEPAQTGAAAAPDAAARRGAGPAEAPAAPAPAGLAAAWPLLLAGFCLNFLFMGGGVDTISVFLHAISAAEGWSISSLSGGVTVAALTAALLTPLVGVAVDRWGVRAPMGLGLVLFAAGYALLVRMTDPVQWLVAQLFLGSGFAFSAILPLTVAVTLCVPHRTSLALGIVGAGASVGTLVLAPLYQVLIEGFGWRDTYRLVGTAMVLLPVPLLLFCLPRGRLRRPSDDAPGAGGASLRDDLRRPEVQTLGALMLVPALVSFGVHVHLVPLLTDARHGPGLSAAALGAAIGISALGKLAGGFLGDRFGPLAAFRTAMLLECAAVAALARAESLALVGLFVVAHGLALGTRVAVLPVIALGILGTHRFGTRFGLLQLVITMGAALAPLLPALVRDHTGSYRGAVGFWVAAVAFGVWMAFRLRIPAAR